MNMKKYEINKAKAHKNKLEPVKLVLLLCVWENILKFLFVVFKILQSITIH